MGRTKDAKKRRRKLESELERKCAEAILHLEQTRADAQARADQLRTELDSLESRAADELDRAVAKIDLSIAPVETRREQTFIALEALRTETVEQTARDRAAIETARVEAITATRDLTDLLRSQATRLERAVEFEISRLEEQFTVAGERAAARVDAAADERIRALDELHLAAAARVDARAHELEHHLASLEERFAAADATATTPNPPPAPLASTEVDVPDVELELGAFALPPAPAPTSEPVPTSEKETGPVSPIAPESPGIYWEATTTAEPLAAHEPLPSSEPPVGVKAEAATCVALSTLSSGASHGSVIEFETSGSQLVASLSQLQRAAADGQVRVEPVHRTSSVTNASLRLTVQNLLGGWERHDVPGHVSSGARRPVTVDLHDLLQAVQFETMADDAVSLTLDADITVGTVLVLGQNTTLPILAGERRKVERIQPIPTGHDDLQLDTLAGRLALPSRVASSLRSRRADAVDLITVGEQPCLSAQVPGPTDAVTATIEIPLHSATTSVDEHVADRREIDRNPINQLVSALSTGSTPEELVAIISDGVGYARRRAASHPSLPPGVIVEILRDGTESMRAAAAANPSIPPSAIEHAAVDDAPAVRAAVAANPAVPPALLFTLLRDDSAQVRMRVARNPALPPEMLALLTEDPDASVRSAVAEHGSCPVETLVALANDQFPGVCAHVALHASCPVDILEQLLSVVPEAVLSNPRAPEHLLIAGSQVASPSLRAAVAANPATPLHELQALARDPDRRVVRAVSSNPNAPTRVRRKAGRRSERAGAEWREQHDA